MTDKERADGVNPIEDWREKGIPASDGRDGWAGYCPRCAESAAEVERLKKHDAEVRAEEMASNTRKRRFRVGSIVSVKGVIVTKCGTVVEVKFPFSHKPIRFYRWHLQ